MRAKAWGMSAAFAVGSFWTLGALADSGESWSPERLIPEEQRPIKSDFNLRGSGDDDYIGGRAFVRTPLYQSEEGYLLFEGGALVGHVWDDDQTYYQGSAGLILRAPLDEENAFGLNGFFDFGSYGAFAGQASVGLEYEHVTEEALSLRLGANSYLPLQDYTEQRAFSRAPRLGGDLYAGVGKQWDEHRLEGFLTGFYYAETGEAHGLWGMVGEVEWRYEDIDFLPEGSHLYANAGARYDSYEDAFSPIFGLGFSIALNEQPTDHDRVAEVRRNIAFGSAFVPIDYKPLPATAAADGGSMGPLVPVTADQGCGPGGPSSVFTLNAEVDLDDGASGYIAPVGTTLLELVGLDPIVAACDFTVGGGEGQPPQMFSVSQCVEELAALDRNPNNPAQGLPMNNGSYVAWFSPSGSCEVLIGIFGG